MPEISALSLPAALTSNVAAPLENAGVPGESGTLAGTTPHSPSFDALLAMQTTLETATGQAAAALLPESGKVLPDDASAVAARTRDNLIANVPNAILPKAPHANRAADTATPTQNHTEEAADGAADFEADAELAPLPDIAMFAAIFAAPERLANGPSDQPVTPPPAQPGLAAATAIETAATAPASGLAVAVAIASTARIERVSHAQKSMNAPVAPMTTQAATAGAEVPSEVVSALAVQPAAAPVTPPLGAVPAPNSPEPNSPKPNSGAPNSEGDTDARAQTAPAARAEAFTPQVGESILPGTITADAPVQTDALPAAASRSEVRAERIDFATLVDTLNRAREDASPRTLNVAVTNTDFGRVSMRFDSTDAGLSVAMSAADPAFVRAVSASSEAASTNADTRGQSGQSSQPQAESGTARQQQGQPSPQQQAGTTRGDPRGLAIAAPNSRRENDAASSSAKTGESGIYA